MIVKKLIVYLNLFFLVFSPLSATDELREAETSHISHLPKECLLHIFGNLDMQSAVQSRLVCTPWDQRLQDDQNWKWCIASYPNAKMAKIFQIGEDWDLIAVAKNNPAIFQRLVTFGKWMSLQPKPSAFLDPTSNGLKILITDSAWFRPISVCHYFDSTKINNFGEKLNEHRCVSYYSTDQDSPNLVKIEFSFILNRANSDECFYNSTLNSLINVLSGLKRSDDIVKIYDGHLKDVTLPMTSMIRLLCAFTEVDNQEWSRCKQLVQQYQLSHPPLTKRAIMEGMGDTQCLSCRLVQFLDQLPESNEDTLAFLDKVFEEYFYEDYAASLESSLESWFSKYYTTLRWGESRNLRSPYMLTFSKIFIKDTLFETSELVQKFEEIVPVYVASQIPDDQDYQPLQDARTILNLLKFAKRTESQYTKPLSDHLGLLINKICHNYLPTHHIYDAPQEYAELALKLQKSGYETQALELLDHFLSKRGDFNITRYNQVSIIKALWKSNKIEAARNFFLEESHNDDGIFDVEVFRNDGSFNILQHANLCWKLGMLDHAKQFLQLINPNNILAFQYINYIKLLYKSGESEKADQLGQQAIDLLLEGSLNWSAWQMQDLAVLYCAVGQNEKAKAILSCPQVIKAVDEMTSTSLSILPYLVYAILLDYVGLQADAASIYHQAVTQLQQKILNNHFADVSKRDLKSSCRYLACSSQEDFLEKYPSLDAFKQSDNNLVQEIRKSTMPILPQKL